MWIYLESGGKTENMIGISEEKFKKEVNIYFNNINEGFLKYKSKT